MSTTASEIDEIYLRRLTASVIRRAPMDATNILINESDETISAVLKNLDSRLSQKILRHLPEERIETLNNLLSETIGEQWEINLAYEEDTIGRIMESPVGLVSTNFTVQATIDLIREYKDNNVIFTYAYVVDDNNKLAGVVVMRDLLFAEPTEDITDTMIENPFYFKAETSVKAAMLDVVHRHYPVYPVCDDEKNLIGLVQGYELFEEHAIEVSAQAGQMVGIDNEEHLNTPIKTCFVYRHPWLQLNLLTGFIAAFIVGMFEDTIQQIVLVAAFLPVLAGQSGNTGCQALAVTLRGMTLGEFKKGFEKQLIIKELKLGIYNGALVGITAAVAMLAYAHLTDFSAGNMLAGVVFLAMFASCILSGVTGVAIPLILKRFGADPVTASTIFLTTLTDIISMGLLLGLTTILVL